MYKTKPFKKHWIWLLTLVCSIQLSAQETYQNHQQITNKLKKLRTANPSVVKLQSLVKTDGGYDIWALTLAKGNHENNPAFAIVGGVDGSRLITTEMAVQIAENLVANHQDVLAKTTFYIFPNMSPKASESYFSNLKFERRANNRSTDDDRDGRFDEDPFEDLNKDGMITLIRVEDATGNYVKLEEDERIMVKANREDGQLGAYKIYSEGVDNDFDGMYNEDGKGGVEFNKNLSYKYPFFQTGSGEHTVSEKEHRALLDFLYERWNLYGILTLGPSNNLSSPLKFNAGNAKKRVVTSILKKDQELNKMLSEKYKKITKLKDAPDAKEHQGGFFEWSYFHFGKLAMSTPGWWAPKFEGDTVVKANKNKDANFLQWAKKENLSNYFVDWKSVNHPDFPNRSVEVGGISPYVRTNPPYQYADSISKIHTDFIVDVVKMQPSVKLENVKTERVNGSLTRITVDVHNQGFLPTHTALGKRSRWLRNIKVDLKLKGSQQVLSGRKIQMISSLDGDETEQISWLVSGRGSVTITAGAAHTGTDQTTINLK